MTEIDFNRKHSPHLVCLHYDFYNFMIRSPFRENMVRVRHFAPVCHFDRAIAQAGKVGKFSLKFHFDYVSTYKQKHDLG